MVNYVTNLFSFQCLTEENADLIREVQRLKRDNADLLKKAKRSMSDRETILVSPGHPCDPGVLCCD